jgi:hypothetical protein
MLAYAVTISEIEAGLVRLPGEPKKAKNIKKSDKKPENLTEEGEEQC